MENFAEKSLYKYKNLLYNRGIINERKGKMDNTFQLIEIAKQLKRIADCMEDINE